MNSKLIAEGIMGAAMRMGAELSGVEFPISVFPHKIQRVITELHASQDYPIDNIAVAMLSALAVSIGNSHLAQVKRGWVESPIQYMALIGRLGANKSHPLSLSFQPFVEHDNLNIIRKLIGESINLNQLAKQANRQGFFRVRDECQATAFKISQLIKRIKDDR